MPALVEVLAAGVLLLFTLNVHGARQLVTAAAVSALVEVLAVLVCWCECEI